MDAWSRADQLIDRARSVADLQAHRLHLYAAWRWRSLGRPVAGELVELEREAAVVRLAAPAILERIRSAYDGPAVLFKGPEVAARYPTPQLRPYVDLDLLVPAADEVQRLLLGAGFREAEVRAPDGHHHAQPLEWPGMPLRVEIHSKLNWPLWLRTPPSEEIMTAATLDSVFGMGVTTLPPVHHTLILAAHAWREAPLTRVGDLLDIVTMSAGADDAELERLAGQWGLGRLWPATLATIDSVLFGSRDQKLASRVWTRNLETLRERTVFTAKVSKVVAPFWGLKASAALGASMRELASDLRPEGDETWGEKVRRTGGALRQAGDRRSARDRALRASRDRKPDVD